MRKITILFAVCAVLFSCQREDSPKVDPTAKYEIKSDALPAPSAAEKSMLITVDNPAYDQFEVIELTESGMFLAYEASEKTEMATKSSGDENIVSGTYTIKDGYFVFFAGVEVKIPADVAINAITSIYINGVAYSATATPTAAGESASITSFCRTWFPTKFHASLMSNGTVLYNKEGKTITDLQDDLFTYVLNAVPSAADLLFDAELQSFIFTNNKTAAVVMAGAEYEVCEWESVGDGKVKFILNGTPVVASTYFKAGTPNTMYILIDLDTAFEGAEDYDITVSGRLVVTMVDAQ